MIAVPDWVTEWVRSRETGASSMTILYTTLGIPGLIEYPSAPSDTSDVYRCVRLLDLAERHGANWRPRLPELVAIHPPWGPLIPRWSDIEDALREGVEAQTRVRQQASVTANGRPRKRYVAPVYPPSRCWWLVSTLRGHGDPYARYTPHPFESKTHEEAAAGDSPDHPGPSATA